MKRIKRGFDISLFVVFVFCIGICFSIGSAEEGNSGKNSSPPKAHQLRFQATENKEEYQFNTGVVQGTLRQKGKSRGLSAVTYLPQKVRIDGSTGLFGFYRIFSENTRYGTALWDRDSTSKLLPDGAVKVHWPAEKESPFEITAIYRWVDASTLDLETIVKPAQDLLKFEVFLASYFHKDFPASYVYVQKESPRNTPLAEFVEARESGGTWQMYPRYKQVLAMIKDGRWQQKTGVTVVLMARPQDCFAIATPCTNETHYSQYHSLFGQDLKKGKIKRTHSRLLFTPELTNDQIVKRYQKFIQETKSSKISLSSQRLGLR